MRDKIVKRLFVPSLLILCSLGASISNAALEWESLTHETIADLDASEVRASFNFTNKGDYTINIKDIVSGCGCTAVELEDRSIEPGESGQVAAVLHVGSRQGLQHKSIRVHTDDPQEPVIKLTLKCYIPKLADILPKVIFWKVGETPVGKNIEISNKQDEAFHIKNVAITNHTFNYDLQTIEEGHEYRLTVTPNSTESPVSVANIFIEIQSANASKRYTAYASIK